METSVLLVVRNCEKYIKECLDSILAQTYTDFELLIVDDASTDVIRNCVSESEKYNK